MLSFLDKSFYRCAHLKLTSVSCSLCPIRDRDSPSSCRWAAASMGSTSGTRAGDRDMVPGALVGDTTPVDVPATLQRKRHLQTASKDPTVSGRKPPPSQSNIPLLLVSLDVLCLTVVASALFCLCCKYWAFCLQTYRKTYTWSTPPALKGM